MTRAISEYMTESEINST